MTRSPEAPLELAAGSRHDPLMKILNVQARMELLPRVVALGDQNKGTLGFLAADAVRECAERGWILAAVAGEELLGYLLFRRPPSKDRASITHLCVASDSRRSGVASALVRALKEESADLAGISLWCRRDYEAANFWPTRGFVVVAEKAGRGIQPHLLENWWFDHCQRTLLDGVDTDEELELAVLDQNVFLDLVSPVRPARDSAGLDEAWLFSYLDLCLTPEILNEIAQGEDEFTRKENRRAVSRFRLLRAPDRAFQEAMTELDEVLGSESGEKHAADRRQLAHALANNADYFVTRDRRLLGLSERVESETGLLVLRPSRLVLSIDSLYRRNEYQLRRLRGCRVVKVRRERGDIDDVVARFLSTATGEKKHELRELLHRLGARPQRARIDVVNSESPRGEGLLALEATDGVAEAYAMRMIGRSPKLLCNMLVDLLEMQSARENLDVLIVKDQHLPREARSVLRARRFFEDESGYWCRVSLRGVMSAADALGRLEALEGVAPPVAAIRKRIVADGVLSDRSTSSPYELERVLRPAKIHDADVPNYIIPIQPQWAAELFDEGLAGDRLLSERADTLFSRKNVYYRSRRPYLPKTPARVMWYVSGKKGWHGSGSVRAVSVLESAVVGRAKSLFAKYKDLGVYEWRHLMKLTGDDPQGELMVLLFADTECLGRPVPIERVRSIFRSHGKAENSFQGPVMVPSALFLRLYSEGRHG